MPASVQIHQPIDGFLTLPSARSVVVDITTPGTDPGREFHIAINSVNQLTIIGGAITFTGTGYTASITPISATAERVTLTRTTDWPNPFDLKVEAAYRPVPTGVIFYAESNSIAASYIFQASAPYPGQPDVSPQTDIVLSINTPAQLQLATLTIAGVGALKATTANPVWNSPDFTGRFSYANGVLTIAANPRRQFDNDAIVEVNLTLGLSAGGAIEINNSFIYQFHVRPELTDLINNAARFTRVDRPYQNAPASETLRYLLRGALLPRPNSPSFEVALYAYILKSSLGSVAAQFNRQELVKEVDRLVGQDLPDVTLAATRISEIDILWESVLLESRELGLSKDFLDLIARTYEAPYPQERVGAASAVIFAQAGRRP